MPSLARLLVCSDSSQFSFREAFGLHSLQLIFSDTEGGAEVPIRQAFALVGLIARHALRCPSRRSDLPVAALQSRYLKSNSSFLPGLIFSNSRLPVE